MSEQICTKCGQTFTRGTVYKGFMLCETCYQEVIGQEAAIKAKLPLQPSSDFDAEKRDKPWKDK